MANFEEQRDRQRLLYNADSDDDMASLERQWRLYGDPWRGFSPGSAVRGPYTGFGPRGYKRSDDRIKEDVCDLLTQHGEIDASDIDVSVDRGEVTLQGTVDSRRTKRGAEALADSVYGVTDVHNELHIRSLMQEKETNSHQELPEQAKSSRKG